MKLRGNLEIMAACKGMNMSQLADKANLSRQSLSTIKNRGTCSALTAVKIATALDMPPESLLDNGESGSTSR